MMLVVTNVDKAAGYYRAAISTAQNKSSASATVSSFPLGGRAPQHWLWQSGIPGRQPKQYGLIVQLSCRIHR